ncbi:MAG: Hsp20/alpha crystallin family protein [Halobacteriota archaeon]|nr:Hsp20/alpha crystallin family protein [Halobacteriota archaeon]
MVKWYWFDPMEEMRRIEDRMDSLFREVFEDPYRSTKRLLPGRVKEGLVRAGDPYMDVLKTAEPYIDVKDEDGKLMVKADIPGVKKEDIDLTVKGDMLEITAERKDEKEEKEEDYIRKERRYSKYFRTIRLPTEIDLEKTEAKFKDGVLELTMPKTEVEEDVKKIEVE